MAIDVEAVSSPGWWLKKLADALWDRRAGRKWQTRKPNAVDVRPGLDLLWDYYRNEPPLPLVAASWGETTAEFLRLARMNYAALVVNSVTDRLMPRAWRTSQDSDRDGDARAQAISDANHLDIVLGDAVENALTFGDGYTLLGSPRKGSKIPLITSEDPRQFITADDPGTGDVRASLKMFRDDWTDEDLAYVTVRGEGDDPTRRYVARRTSKTSVGLPKRFDPRMWEWEEGLGGLEGEPLPPEMAGFVPAARFRNRDGVGEFEPHLSVLDRINDGIFDRITIAKHQAHRQRGLKDAPTHYPEDHPLAGQEVVYDESTFSADPGAMWLLPPGVSVWESAQSDMSGIRYFIKDDVEALAAVTFTPLHYINPDAANGSAEGAVTMREGHIFRVEDRSRRMQLGNERMLQLAFRAMGDMPRATGKVTTIWAPFERFSKRDKMEAAQLAKQAGLTQASIYTDVMDYAPSDLARLQQERAEDFLFAPAVEPKQTGPVTPEPSTQVTPAPGEQVR